VVYFCLGGNKNKIDVLTVSKHYKLNHCQFEILSTCNVNRSMLCEITHTKIKLLISTSRMLCLDTHRGVWNVFLVFLKGEHHF
jgi:hypothetical protein